MKKIKNVTNALIFCSVCLVATGCASTKVASSNPIFNGVEQQDTYNQIIDERTVVRVSVSSSENSKLSTLVCNNAESYLAKNNYSVTKGNADLYLKLDIEESVYDESGEYIILDGVLSNVLTTRDNSKILARMPEYSVRTKRTLGDDAARKELAKKLSAQLNAWMEEEISPKKLGVESRNISIFMQGLDSDDDIAYISDFIEKVKDLEGVYAVKLIKQDINQRNFVINVVLSAYDFPEGISNKIMITYPELNLNY